MSPRRSDSTTAAPRAGSRSITAAPGSSPWRNVSPFARRITSAPSADADTSRRNPEGVR
jgi:hypothetical protein